MLADNPIYTTIPVADMERARRWYEEMLGLHPSENPPVPAGEEGIFFDAGMGTRFALFPTRAGAGAGHTVAEFAVGNSFEKVMDDLRGRGVVFEEYDLPGLKTVNGVAELLGPQNHKAAWFKDSEGNVLAIGSY